MSSKVKNLSYGISDFKQLPVKKSIMLTRLCSFHWWRNKEIQEIAYVDTRNLSRSYTEAALRGNWLPMVSEITDAYEKTTSVRQLIEGERNKNTTLHLLVVQIKGYKMVRVEEICF